MRFFLGLLLFSGVCWNAPLGVRSFLNRHRKLPVSFERNVGQADAQVRFIARCNGYLALLTRSELTLWAKGHRSILRMSFVGLNDGAVAQPTEPLPGLANYFIGTDPSHWRTRVPTFAGVQYRNLYPGIDLVFG